MSITSVGFSSFLQENSKKLKMKFPPKIPNRKTKSKTNKGGITQPNINDSLEITKLDSSIISEGKISTITPQIDLKTFDLPRQRSIVYTQPSSRYGEVKLCIFEPSIC